MWLLDGGEAWLAVLDTQEKIGRSRQLPFQPAVRTNGGQAVAPKQLKAVVPSHDIREACLVDANLVRAIDAGS